MAGRRQRLALGAGLLYPWVPPLDGLPPEIAARVEAKRLYQQGKTEFAQGNYVEAAELFERFGPFLLFGVDEPGSTPSG